MFTATPMAILLTVPYNGIKGLYNWALLDVAYVIKPTGGIFVSLLVDNLLLYSSN
jgi:hypothetical protein